MIRWYAVTCWDVLEALGYEWMMRFDDDSFLLSRVDYDWFAAMRREHRDYGFRALSRECDRDFGAFVDAYRASRAVRKSTTGFGAPEVFVSRPYLNRFGSFLDEARATGLPSTPVEESGSQ